MDLVFFHLIDKGVQASHPLLRQVFITKYDFIQIMKNTEFLSNNKFCFHQLWTLTVLNSSCRISDQTITMLQ